MSGGFFRSRWVEPPAGVEELDPAQLAPGFRAGAAHCGLKGGGKTDVALLAGLGGGVTGVDDGGPDRGTIYALPADPDRGRG